MKWGLGVWALLESRGTWHLTHKNKSAVLLADDQQQAAIERACMLLARIPDLGVRIN
jgi:hypothetical protein